MFAGSTSLHEKLEQAIANFVGKPAATVYGMGFATNSTTIPILVDKVGVAL
jgi:serine palmitoyltransferase